VLIRSVKIKIPNELKLIETIQVYAKVCQHVCDVGFSHKTYKVKELRKLTYREIRDKNPNYTSTLVQNAIDSASEMLERTKFKKKIRVTPYSSMRLDKRNLRVQLEYNYASISSVKGRVRLRFEPTPMLSKYKNWKPIAGTLSYNRKQLYLNLALKNDRVSLQKHKLEDEVLGIDRGINNILVCSNNLFFNSKHLKRVKGRYRHLRKVLQNKGTRSAKRKLKQISGRERRFVSDVNHCLSKGISESNYNIFALEKLRRVTYKSLGKRFNRKLGGWSFNEFERFLQYKCESIGKTVVFVNPMHSSQRCSKCGHTERANRRGSNFKCKNCRFSVHADLNASRNIANLGKSEINRLRFHQPNVAFS
jgi:putative transposase